MYWYHLLSLLSTTSSFSRNLKELIESVLNWSHLLNSVWCWLLIKRFTFLENFSPTGLSIPLHPLPILPPVNHCDHSSLGALWEKQFLIFTSPSLLLLNTTLFMNLLQDCCWIMTQSAFNEHHCELYSLA